MKKNILGLCAFLLGMQFTQAQYATLRVAGGYAGPGIFKQEQIIGPKIDPFSPQKDGLLPMSDINDSVPSIKNLYGSYGQGMNFTLAAGYMFNPYIGLEMGVSYLQSATYSCDQTRELTLEVLPGQYSSIGKYMNAHITTNAFGLSIMPSINIQGAKPGWKVYPYGRLGISLPVFGALYHNVKIDMASDVDSAFITGTLSKSPYFLGKRTDVTLKTEGTVSIGFNGAVGVAYKPLPYLAITLELNGQYLVTRAKKAEITKWETDGNDRIADRGVYRTEFNFVDKLDNKSNNEDYNSTTDKTKPKDDLRPTAPFSNLGFNIGVSFMLSKQTLKKQDKPAGN